ncbi:hypothetical protein JW935_05125 [candidate division KSB1 bacterium]|nr:hypothetical protein [candidate division KSB1 bacterium]
MVDKTLYLLVSVPFVVAIINIVLPKVLRSILNLLGSVFLLYLSIRLLLGEPSPIKILEWEVFSMDKLTGFALIFIQILSIIILIYALKGLDKKLSGKFCILYPFTVACCNATVLSSNAVSLVIFWGLSGLVLYLFGLLGTGPDAQRTAKKTFILIGGSDALLLTGLIILFHESFKVNIFLSPTALDNAAAVLAFIMLLIAALAKAGGFPFHTWLPEYSKEAPVESVALLPAALDKILGIYLLARMVMSIFNMETNIGMQLFFITLGAVTVIIAVMMAMIQHNGRKLLGYHAVSQVGYMIMGVGSGNPIAMAGGLFHMINNTIYKSNLFLSLGSVEKQVGSSELSEMGGLGKKMPFTFTMALVGALSISGIPPFNGFFSKWMIYTGILEKAKGLPGGYQLWILLCLVLAVFGSALTLASFLKFIHAIFLGKRPAKLDQIKESSANHWIATGILAVSCLVLGLFAVQLIFRPFMVGMITKFNTDTLTSLSDMYSPTLVILLMLVSFGIGLVVYLLTRKVRYDDNYLGGMPALEKFRVVGTEFYNEIRNMSPLRSLYNAAEEKWCDIYELASKFTVSFSKLLQKAHPGQLQLYLLYIVIGVLLSIWIIR